MKGYNQNVSFDSTFGINARTFIQVGNPGAFSFDYKYTSFRPDQSFFTASAYNHPDSNFFIAKFKPNGSIDSSYASNGTFFIKRADFGISTILGSGFDSLSRFIIIGKIPSPVESYFFRMRIIRFTASAKIDSSFGVNGIADIPLDCLEPSVANYIITSYKDGRLLITCLVYIHPYPQGVLLRLNENGMLDNSFNNGGKIIFPRGGSNNFYTVNIQGYDERILVGWAGSYCKLYRFNTNGTLDNSFNQSGSVDIDFPFANNGINAMRVLSNKKILISAGSNNGNYLYQFKTNGQRDSTFGSKGYVLYNYGFNTYARDLAEQPDGKIITAGVIQDNLPIPNINTLITRTNIDGSVDSTFDGDGVWFFYYGNRPSSGMKYIGLLPSGKLLFSGLESGSDWVHLATYRMKEIYKAVPIPVNWGSAAAIVIKANCSSEVKLSWSTLSEINTSYFVIKHSTDNTNFNPIAQLAAGGNSTSVKNYEYIHISPQPGNNYYRISVVTTNGQELIYGVVTATVTASSVPLFYWQLHEVLKKQDNDCLFSIKLHFITQQPLLSDSITIEYSKDSLNFAAIGKIAVSTQQVQPINYEYTHLNVVFGKHYYRLKISDPSVPCYSPVYKIYLEDIKHIIVYPVPTLDKLFFSQPLPEGSHIALFDMKGSLVLNKEFLSAASEISLANLASGQYLLKIQAYCSEKVIKVIKL